MIRSRTAALLLGVAAAALAMVLATASPAAAHAVVTSSTPTDGQTLAVAPQEAQITFSEGVSADLGGLTVLNSSGERVDNDDSQVGATGNVLSATLQPDLADGTYVMNYRVVSADGHPIAGAIVFAIGTGTVIDSSSVAQLGAGDDAGFELAAGVARFVTYLGALLAAGLAVFVGFVHDQRADRWKLTPIVRIAAVVGGIGAVATVALQAALLTGQGFSAMTEVGTLRDALTEGLDWATVVLLVGLAAVHLSTDTAKPVVAQALAFYGGLAVAASFAFWGHSTTTSPRWLSFTADFVHVATAAVWLGGLVGLGLTLWRRRQTTVVTSVAAEAERAPLTAVSAGGGPSRPASPGGSVDRPAPPEGVDDPGLTGSTAAMVGRFSAIAAVSLILLVVAGALLAWKELGSLSALWSSDYGRVLLVKVGIVALVLVAAAYNRWRLVPQIEGEERDEARTPLRGGAWKHLTRTVLGEALALVVVLGVTAALVNITPPKNAAATESTAPLQTKPVAGVEVEVGLIPSKVGSNSVHITYFDADKSPVDVAQQVTVELTNPEQSIGPITREGTKAATGHYIIDGLQVPTAGKWKLTLVTRVSDFEQERTEFTYDVGK